MARNSSHPDCERAERPSSITCTSSASEWTLRSFRHFWFRMPNQISTRFSHEPWNGVKCNTIRLSSLRLNAVLSDMECVRLVAALSVSSSRSQPPAWERDFAKLCFASWRVCWAEQAAGPKLRKRGQVPALRYPTTTLALPQWISITRRISGFPYVASPVRTSRLSRTCNSPPPCV